ncbi:MAG: methyl-accepting chemotaxis protein [Chromatiales bacterium]|nr:methyl-accepting chemotaxis protein [Chromatiales bacterium]
MRFIKNISIAQRLIGGIGFIVMLLLIVGGLAYRGMTQMNEGSQRFLETAPLIDVAMEMKVSTRTHQLVIMEMLAAESISDIENQWAENQSAAKKFQVYGGAILNGGELNGKQVSPSNDDALRGVVREVAQFHEQELIPKIKRIYEFSKQELETAEAANSDFRKLAAAFSQLESDIVKTKAELRVFAAKNMENYLQFGFKIDNSYLWVEAVDDLFGALVRNFKSVSDLSRSVDADERAAGLKAFNSFSTEVRELLQGLKEGQNRTAKPLPNIMLNGLQKRIESWEKTYESEFYPKAVAFAELTDKRIQITHDRLQFDQEADNAAEHMIDKLGQVEDIARTILRATAAESETTAESAIFESLVVALVGCGVAILFGVLVTTSITQPFNQVVERLEDIAEGEGDLTQRLNEGGKTELGKLAHAFNTFADKIQSMVSQVGGAADELSSAADQTRQVTERTGSGVREQQVATEQAATAMNQMAATVQEVARNSARAAEATQAAKVETERGSAVVMNTVNRINSLASEVTETADVIDKLARDSEDIGGVLDVIREIADQTNLLALNAAIEAARAGEQGRGFAVVADEVRTLAGRTQHSTEEIQVMIENLQQRANKAVEAMKRGRQHAQDGAAEASETGQSLEAITESVVHITDLNTQVASAAEEQSAVANEVQENIVSISEIAKQTTADADRTAAAGDRLLELSSRLQRVVSGFKA